MTEREAWLWIAEDFKDRKYDPYMRKTCSKSGYAGICACINFLFKGGGLPSRLAKYMQFVLNSCSAGRPIRTFVKRRRVGKRVTMESTKSV
jgi:hypothetical protein